MAFNFNNGNNNGGYDFQSPPPSGNGFDFQTPPSGSSGFDFRTPPTGNNGFNITPPSPNPNPSGFDNIPNTEPGRSPIGGRRRRPARAYGGANLSWLGPTLRIVLPILAIIGAAILIWTYRHSISAFLSQILAWVIIIVIIYFILRSLFFGGRRRW